MSHDLPVLWYTVTTFTGVYHLSFYGNDPTNIAYLSFTFNKTALSNGHYQMTLSGASWIDVYIMRPDTKDPVLHKAAMMDTMSPLLFRINGKMK